MAGLAHAEGLGFDPERPIGNTFDIHRVIHLGLAKGVQRDLLNAVNEAYFAQARQVFDRDVITEVAAGAGLDPAAVREVLDGDAYTDEVRQDEAQARSSASAASRSSCSTWRSACPARSRPSCSPGHSTRPGTPSQVSVWAQVKRWARGSERVTRHD